MANSNGWGDGAANNSIGWGQGANNNIGWGDSHAKSWAGATDIVGIDSASSAYFTATGITGATQQTAIDNLVKGLKADGLWSKMKAVYPFVTDQRNLISYSEDFSNAAWIKSNGITITTNQTTAPDGSNTADKIVFGADVNSRVQQVNSNVSTSYVYSVYLKTNSGTTTLQIGNFDSLTTVTITNAWQRFNVNVTTSNAVFTIRNNTAGNSADVFIWGAQFEMGNTLTTYQPQLGSAQSVIASQFKYNLVNPVDSDAAFRLVFNGGWTHSSNGATPNGTNGYADTKLIPNTSIPSINSAHISFYSRTNSDSACDIGVANAVGAVAFQVWPKQSNFRYSRVFSGVLTEATTESTAAYYLNSRLNSANLKAYRNGTMLSNPSLASISNISSALVLSARNDGGTIGSYSNRQTAFASIGDGLSDTEAANLYTRVQAFQTSLNRQV